MAAPDVWELKGFRRPSGRRRPRRRRHPGALPGTVATTCFFFFFVPAVGTNDHESGIPDRDFVSSLSNQFSSFLLEAFASLFSVWWPFRTINHVPPIPRHAIKELPKRRGRRTRWRRRWPRRLRRRPGWRPRWGRIKPHSSGCRRRPSTRCRHWRCGPSGNSSLGSGGQRFCLVSPQWQL